MVDSTDARRKRDATTRTSYVSIDIVACGHGLAAHINGATVSSALNSVWRVHEVVGAAFAREVSATAIGVTTSRVGHALRHVYKSAVRSASRECKGVGTVVNVIVGVARYGDEFSSCASDGVGECFVGVLNQSGGARVGGTNAVVGVASNGGADGVRVGHGVPGVAGEDRTRVSSA